MFNLVYDSRNLSDVYTENVEYVFLCFGTISSIVVEEIDNGQEQSERLDRSA